MFKLLLIKTSIESSVSSSAHTFFNVCSAWLFLYPRLTRAERASLNSPFCGIEPFVDANSRESPSILLRISRMRRSAVLRPVIENFVIRDYTGTSPALLDVDWRGFGASGPVEIQTPNYGIMEINLPISLFDKYTPEIAMQLKSSDAGALLTKSIMNADGIRDQPIENWHFLFDPTGIGVDAAQYGFQTGSVISKYTMGESSLREGIQTEKTSERSEERRVGKECRSRWSPYH